MRFFYERRTLVICAAISSLIKEKHFGAKWSDWGGGEKLMKIHPR